MYKNTRFLFYFVLLIMVSSCTFESAKPDLISDKDLFNLTTDLSNTIFYQNNTLLTAAGNSPHGSFKLRFNATAAAALDAQLELPVGSTFPDGSLLVKELYSGSDVTLYVPMYKRKGAWLWAEYTPSGEAVYSVFKQGAACISCHAEAQNRDLVRTFDLH